MGLKGRRRFSPLLCVVFPALLFLLRSQNGGRPLLDFAVPDWASSPSTASPRPSDVRPRLNTSWHEQVAVEMRSEANLSAVETRHGVLDRTRVALLMENRPLPYLVPLLLHVMSVVPPEWSFRFMGSEASMAMMQANPTVRRQVARGKLFLDLIPYDEVGGDIDSYGGVNRMLTSLWFYQEWIWPARWLFLFQADSIICGASQLTLDDFVGEDWSFIGGSSYGTTSPHSLNGGLSLRKVPHLIRMLKAKPFDEFVASGHTAAEDHYFSVSMWDLPGAKMPVGAEAIRFGVVWEYSHVSGDMPLGFHSYSSDGMFRGPGGQANQDRAYQYCPELGIISVGRWDCRCSPNANRPGGLGG